MKQKNLSYLAVGFSSLFALTSLNAAVVTLTTVKDHSGLIENDFSSFQATRNPDLLWGSAGSATSERRGLVQFTTIDPAVLAPGTIINSVTLRLTSAAAGWASTTLDFRGLLEAGNSDWAEVAGPNGPNFGGKANSPTTAWIGGTGLESNLTAPVLGSLTSVSAGGAGTVFDTSFAVNPALLDFLAGPGGDNQPHLFVTEQTPGAGAQTRFFSREGSAAQAPQLIIDFTPVPEPSTALLAGLGVLGLMRRRR